MPVPDLSAVQVYLAAAGSTAAPADSADAYAAEKAAQSVACRVPADADPWPADLGQALCRRVHRNLAMRSLPLGAQPSISEAGVGTFRPGSDPEVRRLEAPWRRLVVG